MIQKASRLQRWWTCVPKKHLPHIRVWASFILKGVVVVVVLWLVAAGFFMVESFVLLTVYRCLITMFL